MSAFLASPAALAGAGSAPLASFWSPSAGADPEYVGVIKSYNERRGFGFVACPETAQRFGRDVYISKAEAQLVIAGEGSSSSTSGSTMPTPIERPARAGAVSGGLALEEDDFIRFHVRLSALGFPQAEQIQRLRKFQATVTQAPSDPNCSEDVAHAGRAVCDNCWQACSQAEVLLDREACGQARLAMGDRVQFCLRSSAAASQGALPEARLALVSARPPHLTGSILACFTICLPRPPAYEGGPSRPDLQLEAHALEDRVILAGLPSDAGEAELMRFFGKHGGTSATVAQAQSGLQARAFAAIALQSLGDVARLVGRSTHTFADDKETRTVRLYSQCASTGSRLPGLPAPLLAGGDAPGVLLVRWSPVILATGYVVELRPAGLQAAWSAVDAPEGRLGDGSAGRFGRECSSCRVSGLLSNVVFEARVTYAAACGCRSDASDASEWCIACPSALPVANPGQLSVARPQRPAPPGPLCSAAPPVYMGSWPPAELPPQFASPAPPVSMQTWQAALPAGLAPPADCLQHMGMGFAPPADCLQHLGMGVPAVQHYAPMPWCCLHGTANPPPARPDARFADDGGYSVSVQWPAAYHAAAYVVELRGAQRAERFIRAVPLQPPGSLVELTIGGFHLSEPGLCYSIQVRCIAGCGCESDPSPAATLQVPALPMPFAPQLPPAQLPPAIAAPAPTCVAPRHAPGAEYIAQSFLCAEGCFEQDKFALPQLWPPRVTSVGVRPREELPSLLASRTPSAPPPAWSPRSGARPAFCSFEPLKQALPEGVGAAVVGKETPPEVIGDEEEEEEDCIVLD